MSEGKYTETSATPTVCKINVEDLKDVIKEKEEISKKDEFGVKQFKSRDSIITAMMKQRNFRSFYNIIVSILVLLMLETLVNDYYTYGRIYFMTRTITTGFGKFHIGFLLWAAMQLMVLFVYCAFQGWAYIRYLVKNNDFCALLWDLTGMTTFVAYQLAFFLSVQFGVFVLQFPIATGLTLVAENVRFMMKVHAFVRTNAPLRLHKMEHSYSFKSYAYFVFAPTLIYRDEYPRTERIKWRFVARMFFEFFGTIFFLCYFYEKFLDPFYAHFGKTRLSFLYLLNAFFTTMVPTYLIVMCMFYNIFQAWLNFAAELLRFGDRRFYRDWWLSPNYGSFYRTWNAPVHEWLYEYIYKDVYRHIFKGSKFAAVMTVVFISALFHEILLMSVLRFLYPVLFILFGVLGTLAIYMTRWMPRSFGNLFFWFTIPLGVCIMFTSYTIEFYSRANCPVGEDWTDYIIPATWRCGVLDFSYL